MSDTDALVGTKLGNYRLERLLGRGRMGVVYLACDEALLRPTAVKILSWSIPESVGQNPESWFIAEARNVARVNHPHVVQIYNVARHGAYCYIAMEYVDGATADIWITRDGPYGVERATELLIQMSGALQAAHDAKVVHRDIKPENLLVGGDGIAKLGDFGMAMHTVRPRAMDAGRAGTPYYTAPEIWRGEAATASSDIYALGATYFYLLTGRPPFVASELQELIAAHLNSAIPELRTSNGSIPTPCQELLQRCMAKSPNQRFTTAQALGWEARAVLSRMSSAPPPLSSSMPRNVTGTHRGTQDPPSNLAGFTTPVVSPASSLPAPSNDWRAFFGFLRDPFTQGELGATFYRGEPFASLLDQLDKQLGAVKCPTVLLMGANGTGRTSTAQALLAQQVSQSLCARISSDGLGAAQTLAKRALRALGVATTVQPGSARDIDALVESCLEARGPHAAPLLVVDDCDRAETQIEELASLVLAAHLTDSFRLLLLANPGFDSRLASCVALANTDILLTMHMPALQGPEVAGYLTGWLNCSLAPDAAPVIFTPDAILIVTYRSQGNLWRINQLFCNMLMAGAVRERRVFDTWDAWSAPMEPSVLPRPTRPKDWPTPVVMQVLNQCRREAGMQPRR